MPHIDGRTGEIVIRIDPGLAFGAGTHPTTQMCLRELERVVRPGMRVLDFGAGTAVLAVAALKLGASFALAVDNDPIALATAARVARRNGVALSLSDSPRGEFDVVVANLPPEAQAGLDRYLAPGGVLISSGFTSLERPSGWSLLVLRTCAATARESAGSRAG